MHKIFIYGTLLDKKIQNEVIGRTQDGKFTLVDNYILMRDWEVEGTAYPRLYPHSAGCVIGEIIEVTDEELKSIDEWETNRYIRQDIHLKGGEFAQAYFANIWDK